MIRITSSGVAIVNPTHTQELMKKAIIALLITAASVTSTLCQAEENLLKNGSFTQFDKGIPTAWNFSKSNYAKLGSPENHVLYGVIDSGRQTSALQLTLTHPVKAHLWWEQTTDALPGSNYSLEITSKAESVDSVDGGYAGLDIGIYFLDSNNRWIGYANCPNKPKIDGTWQTSTMTVTAPDNAYRIGVRLGIVASRPISVLFDSAKLTYAD